MKLSLFADDSKVFTRIVAEKNIKIMSDVVVRLWWDQGMVYIKWRAFNNNLAEKRISIALSEFLSSPILTLQVGIAYTTFM